MPKKKERTSPTIVEHSADDLNKLDDPSWFDEIGQLITDIGVDVELDMFTNDRMWNMSTSDIIEVLHTMHDEKKRRSKKLRRLGLD